ncbi:MAG: sigma-54-dependent Fis family transcriptional regulator, partial [Deltaproteobacteria bacterium]
KKGRFELADGGTLFLDEIGELPHSLQVKLLRVLQEKAIERVGGVKSIAVDIRVLVATNKNLKQEVQKGRFREDLFFRLNVVNLVLPPLRQRREDLHILTKHFIAKYSSAPDADMQVKTVDKEVERLFHDYRWPGNVRELENVIERALIMCTGDTITIADLPRDLKDGVQYKIIEEIPGNAKLYETLAMIEKKMILRSLKMTNNVQTRAAALLGIGKSGLNQKIKKYNLEIDAGN